MVILHNGWELQSWEMRHSPKHFDEIASLFSASCPFGKLSVRQNVRSAKCPFGKTSVRQNVRRQNARSAKCLSAKCLSAKCPCTRENIQPRSCWIFSRTARTVEVSKFFIIVRLHKWGKGHARSKYKVRNTCKKKQLWKMFSWLVKLLYSIFNTVWIVFQNVRSAKRPFGKTSVGKMSVRQNVFRQNVFRQSVFRQTVRPPRDAGTTGAAGASAPLVFCIFNFVGAVRVQTMGVTGAQNIYNRHN